MQAWLDHLSHSHTPLSYGACITPPFSGDPWRPWPLSRAYFSYGTADTIACLLVASGVTIEGKEAVVIGRSNIVGIPVSLLLMQASHLHAPLPSHIYLPIQPLRRTRLRPPALLYLSCPAARRPVVVVLQKNATVTIVHSRTKDPKSVVSRADIVVAAVGRAEMVRHLYFKSQTTL